MPVSQHAAALSAAASSPPVPSGYSSQSSSLGSVRSSPSSSRYSSLPGSSGASGTSSGNTSPPAALVHSSDGAAAAQAAHAHLPHFTKAGESMYSASAAASAATARVTRQPQPHPQHQHHYASADAGTLARSVPASPPFSQSHPGDAMMSSPLPTYSGVHAGAASSSRSATEWSAHRSGSQDDDMSGTSPEQSRSSAAAPAAKSRRTASPAAEAGFDTCYAQNWSSHESDATMPRRSASGSVLYAPEAGAGSSRSSPRQAVTAPIDPIAAEAMALARSSPRSAASYDVAPSSARSSPRLANGAASSARASPRLDLAHYPAQDLLRVLATLLHQIATANDELRPSTGGAGSGDEARRRSVARLGTQKGKERPGVALAGSGTESDVASSATALERPPSSASTSTASAATLRVEDAQAGPRGANVRAERPSITTASLGALGTPSSTLCFHARNVPSISIESYLLRILKYCPTTNEVFLSLLVYFDRMSRMGLGAGPGSSGTGSPAGAAAGLPPADGDEVAAQTRRSAEEERAGDAEPHPGMRGFAIDSYNVHRLVIAGVTVASKFFSDVFYTNSRYAKVGGLPVHELNQLELQFLLLNDFRLVVPLEEMQRYADELLRYGVGQSPALPRELGPADTRTAATVSTNRAAQDASAVSPAAGRDVAMRDA